MESSQITGTTASICTKRAKKSKYPMPCLNKKCNTILTSKSYAYDHRLLNDKCMKHFVKQKEGKTEFECCFCGKIYTSKKALAYHQKSTGCTMETMKLKLLEV